HIRGVALAALLDPLELRSRVLGVLYQVEVAAVRDAFELLPADRVAVLDVARPARVMRALLRGVLADTKVRALEAEPEVPVQALLDPVLVPALRIRRGHEELHLHLLELADAEEEVPGRDLVAERLAGLRDPEGRLAQRELGDILEVDEDALCGLGRRYAVDDASCIAPTRVSNIRLNCRASVRSH